MTLAKLQWKPLKLIIRSFNRFLSELSPGIKLFNKLEGNNGYMNLEMTFKLQAKGVSRGL